jgi:hypothetical protein
MSAIASPPQAVFKSENIIVRSADAAEWLQCASRLRSGRIWRTCLADFSTIFLYNTLIRVLDGCFGHEWPSKNSRGVLVPRWQSVPFFQSQFSYTTGNDTGNKFRPCPNSQNYWVVYLLSCGEHLSKVQANLRNWVAT